MEHNLFHQGLDVPYIGVGGQGTLHRRALQDAIAVAMIVVFQQLGHATVPNRQVRRIVLLLGNLCCDGQIYGVKSVVVTHQIKLVLVQQDFDVFRRLLCGNGVHENQG